jgi:DNA mismatch repair protein MSH5
LLNDLVAELDCIRTFVKVIKEYNLVKPVLVDESVVLIKEGRYLLTEQINKGVKQFVSNDLIVYNYIDEYDNSVNAKEADYINPNYSNRQILLTGPNYSGKSIFLKQIGLIVYMAHIGIKYYYIFHYKLEHI